MSKAVFIASSHSGYDDRPGEAYHFPDIWHRGVARAVDERVTFDRVGEAAR
jgi:putative restriction endonuclease